MAPFTLPLSTTRYPESSTSTFPVIRRQDLLAVLLLRQQKDLQTSSFKFSGEGSAAFDLVGKAEQNTTCASKPQKIKHLNDIPVKPGMTYWLSDQPCTPGTASYAISGSNGFSLEYFQDYKPSPIGLYVRAC
jgi:hypothetical protein